MKLIKSFDSEAKAEIAKAMLVNSGIEAVTMGSDSSTIVDSLEKTVSVFVVNDTDSDRATRVVNGELAESADIRQLPDQGDESLNIAIIMTRISGLFFMVYGLDYMTYMGENMTDINGDSIQMTTPYRIRMMWDGIRVVFHLIGGLIMIYYSEPLAKALCFGLRRNRQSNR